MDEPATHLFAYGTLTFPEVWDRVAGRRFESRPATVRGFQVVFARGKLYPVMFRAPATDEVSGLAYLNLDAETLARLDDFESTLYQREAVEVELAGGDLLSCQAYILPPERRHFASNRPWRREVFQRDELQRYLQAIS